jgi:hypothetical protein
MHTRWADFTGRLPQELYRDALDLALVFNQSLSSYLAGAINAYVDAQLDRRVVSTAVDKIREVRGNRMNERRLRAASPRGPRGGGIGPKLSSKGEAE